MRALARTMVETFGGGEVVANITNKLDGGYDPATSRNAGTHQIYSINVPPPIDAVIQAEGEGTVSVTTIVIAKTILDAVTVTQGAATPQVPTTDSGVTVTGPDGTEEFTVYKVEKLQADSEAAAWLVHCTRVGA